MSFFKRRTFLKLLAATGLVATTDAIEGCAPGADDDSSTGEDAVSLEGFEFIVIGSGAGGGPLAANLARQGHKVLLLEAGEDRGASLNYEVPAFHPKSTEDETMRWDYFVKHYGDEGRTKRDTKLTYEGPDGRSYVGGAAPPGSQVKGVLYPRAGTLGGCTSHNAMITIYPHESDWSRLAALTGDESFAPANMRRYYQLLERCEYLGTSEKAEGHGFKGWLTVNRASPSLALEDAKFLQVLKGAAFALGSNLFADVANLVRLLKRDMNENGPQRDKREGLGLMPLAVDSRGKRNGPREYLLRTVAEGKPLTIHTGALASRILFEEAPGPDGKLRAIGVEFIEGKRQYRADPKAGSQGQGRKRTVFIAPEHRARGRGEIIVACGAFNTPQLLKLSGIGSEEELAPHGIKVRVRSKAVGANLQDRYEVCVVSEVDGTFRSIEGCTFGNTQDDPCLAEWRKGKGVYTTNGVLASIVMKSSAATGTDDPDLIVFGAPGYFRGYYPGYSADAIKDRKYFSWAILKGHTRNRGGSVSLRSADPRDVPEINFRYFDEGTTAGGADDKDLLAMVDGVKFARKVGKAIGNFMGDDIPLLGGKYEERVPGPAVASDDQIKRFVKDEAWGHHASCTCPMGREDDDSAVLNSRFEVKGTKGLRVVDASVFPQIPGFFIVVPIYMMSEKATDVILQDLGETRRF